MEDRVYLASCNTYLEAKRLRAVLTPSNLGIVYEVTKKQEPVERARPYWHLEAVTQDAGLLAAVLPGLRGFVEGYEARARFEREPVELSRGRPGVAEWAYRGYSITADGYGKRLSFVHDDYDGAPLETGGPPADHRCGEESTLRDVKEAIDELEDC